MAERQKSDFYRRYDLVEARKRPSSRNPAAHQNKALGALRDWFSTSPSAQAGAMLVLPTGGGKTFAAVRFLCVGPLSEGYKVLWLAHTHHLLEQAFYSFGRKDEAEARRAGYELGWVSEPRQKLNVRVVSGTTGHFPVHQIKPSDDIVICTIQTAAGAYKNKHPDFMAFLDSAGEKLFAVFDEAHHSPAPSYRRLVTQLRKRCPRMFLLGLTATPTYTDEKKRGWLKELFPQGIIYQSTPQELIAERILAQPVLEEFRTTFKPEFDEREYQKWVGTYRDIPEEIITKLAESRDRNSFIADTYVKNRSRYGKTIIFADRWFQCDQLRELLLAQGVPADVIYSHVDADPGSAEARNRRAMDENAQVLARFRSDKLDVLINVRMLTEGTDVPDLQSVFLTRQTTSAILLTQMIGRALRGPRFGGTEQANIVAFIDNWMHLIGWAEYDQLAGKPDLGPDREYGKRPPLHLISIDLVRRLVRQIGRGANVSPVPFLRLLPVGWYRVEFVTLVEGSDDYETVRQLLMVFGHEKQGYERFMESLTGKGLRGFSDEDIVFDDQQGRLARWREQFFSDIEAHLGDDLLMSLFHIARHMAQNDGDAPAFFSFRERDHHDLDSVAREFVDRKLDPRAANQALQTEYCRHDRYWRTLYPNYALFKSQCDACVNRILDLVPSDEAVTPIEPKGERIPPRGPREAIANLVKSRDNRRCLSCGNTNGLQIDHIAPFYLGGDNSMGNLQTLCGICNGAKGIKEINYRNHQTLLAGSPCRFDALKLPTYNQARSVEKWEQFVRRSVNLFYQCAAVEAVTIRKRGQHFYHWTISLYPGNNPVWLEPHLPELVRRIRQARERAGLGALKGFRVTAPDSPEVGYSISER